MGILDLNSSKSKLNDKIKTKLKVYVEDNLTVYHYQIVNEEPFVCFVQEYAMHGDLLQKIKRNDRIDEEESRFYFRQLIEALTVL